MLSFSPVSATHLGPIVFGQERFEVAIFCFSLEHALAIARQDENSTKIKESPEAFFSRTQALAEEGGCDAGTIKYTPLQTMHQWTGGTILRDPEIKMSLVKAQVRHLTIYVFVSDEAPPPVDKPKL